MKKDFRMINPLIFSLQDEQIMLPVDKDHSLYYLFICMTVFTGAFNNLGSD